MTPTRPADARASARTSRPPGRYSARRQANRAIAGAVIATLLIATSLGMGNHPWARATCGTAALLAIAGTTTTALRIRARGLQNEKWARALANGDNTVRIPQNHRDEAGEIAMALTAVQARLQQREGIETVRRLTESLVRKNDELEEVLERLRATQDQVISTQKLAELGQLTAGVAHELRNPLNFIRNFSEASEEAVEDITAILESLNGPPTEQQREALQSIWQDVKQNMERTREHGDRANRIIEDMLAMGRSGRAETATFDVNRIAGDATTLAYQAARSRPGQERILLEQELGKDAGHVTGRAQEIGRVLVNLTTNACHAVMERARNTECDGYMPTVRLETEGDDDAVVIRVRDNGCGILVDTLERVFTPFFTTKPTDQGTGLGLSICHDIVRSHGGEISIESWPNSHTTVTVRLPRGATEDE